MASTTGPVVNDCGPFTLEHGPRGFYLAPKPAPHWFARNVTRPGLGETWLLSVDSTFVGEYPSEKAAHDKAREMGCAVPDQRR